MLILIAKRVGTMVPVLAVILLITLLLNEAAPGDPARVVAGETASPERVEAVRSELGLADPLPTRFWDFTTDVVAGDLGTSLQTRRPVLDAITAAAPKTFWLAAFAMGFAAIGGLAFGLLATVKRGGWIDRLVSALTAMGMAVPPFIVGFALLIPFAIQRQIFPPTGYAELGTGVGDWLRHLTLPALALAVPLMSEVARQVRTSLTEALDQDYITALRASGLAPWAVTGKHALRNAAVPIVTVFGLQASRLIGGAVIVESVFAIPGFGLLTLRAVLSRDLPMIQGVILTSALAVLVVNLVIDLSYAYFNPKLRHAN